MSVEALMVAGMVLAALALAAATVALLLIITRPGC
jgi:hypothetical protein